MVLLNTSLMVVDKLSKNPSRSEVQLSGDTWDSYREVEVALHCPSKDASLYFPVEVANFGKSDDPLTMWVTARHLITGHLYLLRMHEKGSKVPYTSVKLNCDEMEQLEEELDILIPQVYELIETHIKENLPHLLEDQSLLNANTVQRMRYGRYVQNRYSLETLITSWAQEFNETYQGDYHEVPDNTPLKAMLDSLVLDQGMGAYRKEFLEATNFNPEGIEVHERSADELQDSLGTLKLLSVKSNMTNEVVWKGKTLTALFETPFGKKIVLEGRVLWLRDDKPTVLYEKNTLNVLEQRGIGFGPVEPGGKSGYNTPGEFLNHLFQHHNYLVDRINEICTEWFSQVTEKSIKGFYKGITLDHVQEQETGFSVNGVPFDDAIKYLKTTLNRHREWGDLPLFKEVTQLEENGKEVRQ